MKSMFRWLMWVFGLSWMGGGVALAATVTLDAADSGFYNLAGRHAKLDGSPAFGAATPATFNYSVGAIDEVSPFAPDPDVPRKNFFTFDLGGVAPGTITAAVLKLYEPVGGYESMAATETYSVYGTGVPDVLAMAGLAADLTGVWSPFVPAELAVATSLYTALADTKGSMPAFGTLVTSAADDGMTVDISLTTPGLDYLNMFAGGPVVLSGELDSLDTGGPPDDFPDEEAIWGFTSPVIAGVVPWDMSLVTPTATPVLELTIIPEPGVACLLLGGLAGVLRRRVRG